MIRRSSSFRASGPGKRQQWLRARLLGRLHNNIGYLHWGRGRNSQALAQYQRALPHFKTANIPDERADTLNNMAFTLALLGMVDDAQEQAKRALAIRQQLDRRYLIALSHNTRGYIYTLESHPMWGERECREALRIFEDLQEPRGIGLACNALGFTLRKRGDQWKLGETIHCRIASALGLLLRSIDHPKQRKRKRHIVQRVGAHPDVGPSSKCGSALILRQRLTAVRPRPVQVADIIVKPAQQARA